MTFMTKKNKSTYITSSLLDTFDFCKRKKHLNYDRMLVPKKVNLNFEGGGLWHYMLENFYKKVPLQKNLELMHKKYKKERKGKFFSEEQEREMEFYLIMLEGMITGYYNLYHKDLKRWRIIAIERTFQFPIKNRKGTILLNKHGWPYLMTGKIDLLVERTVKGKKGIWIVEHKTAGQIEQSYVERLALDRQTSIYYLGAEHEFPNIEGGKLGDRIQGVIYNPVKKCQIRQRKNETREQFLERLKEDYKTRTEFYYHRFKLRKSPEDMGKHEDDIHAACSEMKNLDQLKGKARRMRAHRRSTFMCTWKGRCEYIPICLNGLTPEIKSMYRKKEAKHEELIDGNNKKQNEH